MKLDNWMRENRQSFDEAEPPEGIWTGLKEHIPQEKKTRKAYWQWSAAAVILLSIGFWWNQAEPKPITDADPKVNLPAGFLAQEANYQQDLQIIEAQIDLSEIATNPDYAWVFEELEELEDINNQYRADLNNPVPKEELLGVLIDYYEKRLRLLRRLQMEIERNQKIIENEKLSL